MYSNDSHACVLYCFLNVSVTYKPSGAMWFCLIMSVYMMYMYTTCHVSKDYVMEPTTVGSLWLENDLHENELEFESYMGRSKKNVRVTSDGIHAEIHEIWTGVAPAAPPLFHAAVNPCLQGESPWNWSCNIVNLRKSTVTWMRWHYVFTVIYRWSTFSSTVNVCNINCVIFSDTHCSFGPPILWHSPFHAGVSVY